MLAPHLSSGGGQRDSQHQERQHERGSDLRGSPRDRSRDADSESRLVEELLDLILRGRARAPGELAHALVQTEAELAVLRVDSCVHVEDLTAVLVESDGEAVGDLVDAARHVLLRPASREGVARELEELQRRLLRRVLVVLDLLGLLGRELAVLDERLIFERVVWTADLASEHGSDDEDRDDFTEHGGLLSLRIYSSTIARDTSNISLIIFLNNEILNFF